MPNSLSKSLAARPLTLPHVITVDGPSASGKGTLSRRLARELGYIYVDSGAMYRTLAWYALRKGVRAEAPMTEADDAAVVQLMRRWKAETRVVRGRRGSTWTAIFPRRKSAAMTWNMRFLSWPRLARFGTGWWRGSGPAPTWGRW